MLNLIRLFALAALVVSSIAIGKSTGKCGLGAIDNLIGAATSSADPGTETMFAQLLASLEELKPLGPTPKSITDVVSRLRVSHAQCNGTGFVKATAALISEGIVTSHLQSSQKGLDQGVNSPRNKNPREPSKPIYPKKDDQDAPYLQTEAQMRQQIYIPSSFTYGKKPPTLLVPGTGARGGNNFQSNFIKLLAKSKDADVVWINPPGYQLADAQTNAETVAYAVNYINGISNRNVTVIGWSQGNFGTQWALKYWPSVRKITTQLIAVSPDYHGTLAGNLLSPLGAVPVPPSVVQQKYNSNFIKALRNNGGDSAYVPTTNVYSGFFDEIVEPQQGVGASAFLKDARGVGVTNAELGKVCSPHSPAGVFATHESVLFNSLTHALAIDALKHGGPAKIDRIRLNTACQRAAAPGLSLQDILATESTIPFAVLQIARFSPKVTKEPEVRHYAM